MEEWYLMEPPTLKDEGKYDIELKDGRIIENVEYWAFGGEFHMEGKCPDEQIKARDVLRWKAL